jgi:putative ABC transport system substrate-binding protein
MQQSLRSLVLFAGALAVSTAALAAPPERAIAVGILISGTPDRWKLIGDALEQGLREQGYEQGKNLVLHKRTATYPDKRMDAYVEELVGKRLDAIVTACGWTTRLASKATNKTPIVMATIADPVGRGFVKSLARPGGNLTGMTGHIVGLAPKMLEHIRIAVPTAKTIAVLANGKYRVHDAQVREAGAAGAAMGMRIVPIDLHRLTSVAAAREAFPAEGAQAVMVLPDDDLFFEYLDAIIPAADELRLPTLFPKRELVWRGAFMSFGADSREIVRRSTQHVVKIANGAVAGQLPIEHPTQVELVLNKTKADQYGIPLPRAAILRAAEVYSR